MPAAAATAPVEAAPKKGKKKLIVAALAALALLLALGAGAMWWLQMNAATNDDDGEAAAETRARADGAAPAFVPLEVFTVNLADRGGERYAQIGVTLELDDAKTTERIKAFMPAIRNNILMVLAHKTSAELLQREGKEQLAAEIRREALRPLGFELPAPGAAGDDAATRPRRAAVPAPVTRVHFSNFIIQ